jgi:hypothetical protein
MVKSERKRMGLNRPRVLNCLQCRRARTQNVSMIWRGNLRSVALGHHFGRSSQHISISIELRQISPNHPVMTGDVTVGRP